MSSTSQASNKPLLHFAHANGFPASTYQKVFEPLSNHYDVNALEMFGHNPKYPIVENWGNSIDEMAEYLEQFGQPVIGVGHSFGGVLTLMTALQRPELFRCVIMLDSIVLRSYEMWAMKFAKRMGWVDKITPAGRTKGRKAFWQNHDEAFAYLQPKSLFKGVDPRVLRDYVESGTVARQDQVHLKFDTETELAIFRNFPHFIKGHNQTLQLPSAYIWGEDSDVVTARHGRSMARRHNSKLREVEGGHLFPMQFPEATAELIHETTKELILQSEKES